MSEHTKARTWRERRKLTRERLSELTGYSPESIYWFERGENPPRGKTRKREAIADWVWTRYRLACSGVDRQLRSGKPFGW